MEDRDRRHVASTPSLSSRFRGELCSQPCIVLHAVAFKPMKAATALRACLRLLIGYS